MDCPGPERYARQPVPCRCRSERPDQPDLVAWQAIAVVQWVGLRHVAGVERPGDDREPTGAPAQHVEDRRCTQPGGSGLAHSELIVAVAVHVDGIYRVAAPLGVNEEGQGRRTAASTLGHLPDGEAAWTPVAGGAAGVDDRQDMHAATLSPEQQAGAVVGKRRSQVV